MVLGQYICVHITERNNNNNNNKRRMHWIEGRPWNIYIYIYIYIYIMNHHNNDDGNGKNLLRFIGFVCTRDKWVMV